MSKEKVNVKFEINLFDIKPCKGKILEVFKDKLRNNFSSFMGTFKFDTESKIYGGENSIYIYSKCVSTNNKHDGCGYSKKRLDKLIKQLKVTENIVMMILDENPNLYSVPKNCIIEGDGSIRTFGKVGDLRKYMSYYITRDNFNDYLCVIMNNKPVKIGVNITEKLI